MSYSTLTHFGPTNTPQTIKRLIISIASLVLLSAAIQSIFDQFDLRPGPVQLLSLSWWGINQLYLWQLATFLFVQPYSSAGITFFYLLSLGFSLYLIWVLATAVFEIVGKSSFLRFYFFCGIGSGLLALLMMPITGKFAMLAGPAPVILALLTAWSMAYPETEVLLFFLIPVKAKWIMAGLVSGIILIKISEWDIANLTVYLFAIFLGHCYSCLAWGWKGPFLITHPFDTFLARVGFKLRPYFTLPSWLRFKKSNSKTSSATEKSKIVDLQTGGPRFSDDAFVDEMLSKISTHGENSLSWAEKKRMQQISERKRKEHDWHH